MLPSFEDFDGHSEKARSFLPWLLMELFLRRRTPVHNEPSAITAAQIEKATVRDYWMDRKNLYRKKKWFPDRTFKKLKKQLTNDDMRIKVKVRGLVGTEVRAMVNYLRSKHNFPIGSAGNGYYWAVSQEDVDITLGTWMDALRPFRNPEMDLPRLT